MISAFKKRLASETEDSRELIIGNILYVKAFTRTVVKDFLSKPLGTKFSFEKTPKSSKTFESLGIGRDLQS